VRTQVRLGGHGTLPSRSRCAPVGGRGPRRHLSLWPPPCKGKQRLCGE
jgi:hypothetical protein